MTKREKIRKNVWVKNTKSDGDITQNRNVPK